MNTKPEYEIKLAIAQSEFPEHEADEFCECSRCGVVEPRETMRKCGELDVCQICNDD